MGRISNKNPRRIKVITDPAQAGRVKRAKALPIRIVSAPTGTAEHVPDPEFNDPDAWHFVGSGASITGGQLRFANPNIAASQTIPLIEAKIGVTYTYSIVVERYPASPITARIRFGGELIYDKDGVGPFSGTVTPTTTGGLIFQATSVGQWYLDSLFLQEGGSNAFLGNTAPMQVIEAPGGTRVLNCEPMNVYVDNSVFAENLIPNAAPTLVYVVSGSLAPEQDILEPLTDLPIQEPISLDSITEP